MKKLLFVSLFVSSFLFVNDINAQDYKGNTPLHYAVASENKDVVKLLIEEGADQNIENFKGITPRFFNPTLKDAVKDYTRTCVLPLLLQSTDLNTDPSTLTKQLSQQVRDVLLLNVNTLHFINLYHQKAYDTIMEAVVI